MSAIRCPSCGMVSVDLAVAQCPQCGKELPADAVLAAFQAFEAESRGTKELRLGSKIIAGIGALLLAGTFGGAFINAPGEMVPLLTVAALATVPWLLYIGIRRLVTGKAHPHPLASFLAYVPLALMVGFVACAILLFVVCSQLRF